MSGKNVNDLEMGMYRNPLLGILLAQLSGLQDSIGYVNVEIFNKTLKSVRIDNNTITDDEWN